MNRKAKILLLVFIILLLGCNRKRDIIPRRDMVPILVEMHILEGAKQIARYNKNVQVNDTLKADAVVLKKYGYTKAQFDSSMIYYSSDLKKFDRIYQEVIVRLSQMETMAQEEKNRQSDEKAKPKTPGNNPPEE
jgi:predicted transposase YdaD